MLFWRLPLFPLHNCDSLLCFPWAFACPRSHFGTSSCVRFLHACRFPEIPACSDVTLQLPMRASGRSTSPNFISLRIHLVCRIRHGFPLLSDDLQPELWAYVGGIVKRTALTLYQVGGAKDHMHVFFGLPETVTVAAAAQSIMAKSSVWIRQQPRMAKFQWQESYGAFSVSASHTERTMAYIRRQKEHHSGRDFDTELVAIARAYGIVPTDRGAWIQKA